jgi:hypothetical protein
MPFGTGSVVTNVGKGINAKRLVGTTPAQLEPKWIAIGVGATGAGRTAAVGDAALSSEQETRAVGTPSTVTTTQTNDTYQTTGTIAATGARAVDEAGTFDQLAAGGNMHTSFTFPVVNLASGDTITPTVKVQFT